MTCCLPERDDRGFVSSCFSIKQANTPLDPIPSIANPVLSTSTPLTTRPSLTSYEASSPARPVPPVCRPQRPRLRTSSTRTALVCFTFRRSGSCCCGAKADTPQPSSPSRTALTARPPRSCSPSPAPSSTPSSSTRLVRIRAELSYLIGTRRLTICLCRRRCRYPERPRRDDQPAQCAQHLHQQGAHWWQLGHPGSQEGRPQEQAHRCQRFVKVQARRIMISR